VCQDFPFQAQLFDFPPQAGQFLTLDGRQSVLAKVFIQIRLPDPLPNRLGCWLELSGKFMRRAARPHKLDHSPWSDWNEKAGSSEACSIGYDGHKP
jgi:hypothetical protein